MCGEMAVLFTRHQTDTGVYILIYFGVNINKHIILLIAGSRVFVIAILVFVAKRSKVFYIFVAAFYLQCVLRLGRPIFKCCFKPVSVRMPPGVASIFVFCYIARLKRRKKCVTTLCFIGAALLKSSPGSCPFT